MKKNNLTNVLACLATFLITLACQKAFCFDFQSAAFSINAETKDIESVTETEKINALLDGLEKAWNNHTVEKVVQYYSDDFVNGDGLPLEAVKSLTSELWEAYPDIKSSSHDRSVRVYGEFATIESVDLYEATSSMIRPEVGTKGTLKAVSMGELFLKKFGPAWKIISDKTFFEKVSIGYGVGVELIDQSKIKLSAPEQVASGHQYTAKLDFDLGEDIKPVAAISKEVLVYPQVAAEDKFRLVNESKLERLFPANKINKNELVTATIGLTGGALKPKLLGLVFLTKRVNVIPVTEQVSEVTIIKSPAKSALNKAVDLLDGYPSEQIEQNSNLKKEEDKEKDKDIKELEPDFDQ